MNTATLSKSFPRYCVVLLLLVLVGCSSDDPVTPSSSAEGEKAAELASAVQAPAEVSHTLEDLEMFRNPLESLSQDVGIEGDLPLGEGWGEDWDVGRVSFDFPDKALLTAMAFQTARTTCQAGNQVTHGAGSPKVALLRAGVNMNMTKAAGDTVAVIYFDTQDSTGFDALIETEETDILRLVSQREYLGAGLLQVASRASEIVLDTNGTLENEDDDRYFRINHEITRGNSEHVQGRIEATDGTSAIEPGVEVRAYHRMDNPAFHILQAWNEAEIKLDPGYFDVDGDETFYELSARIHWRNDAESSVLVTPVTDEAIGPESDVLMTGTFTASPENDWLESTEDTLKVRLGDLDEEEDDLLYEVTRTSVFDATAGDGENARSYIRLVPEVPTVIGEEPCGGTAEQEIHYPETWWLLHLTREVDLGCDDSGSMTVAMEFQDGSNYTQTITWDGAGGATLAEVRADGTTVAGSLNETTGEYSLLTTYPVGHDPVSDHRRGTSLEGSVDATETVSWLDGHQDETHFTMTETATETTVTGYHIEGSLREDFTFVANVNGDTNGTWTSNTGAAGRFTREGLDGGGQRLVFSASDPQAEGSPSIEGRVDFAPDGSGSGTVAFTQYGNLVTFVVTFEPDGSGYLTDPDGHVISI